MILWSSTTVWVHEIKFLKVCVNKKPNRSFLSCPSHTLSSKKIYFFFCNKEYIYKWQLGHSFFINILLKIYVNKSFVLLWYHIMSHAPSIHFNVHTCWHLSTNQKSQKSNLRSVYLISCETNNVIDYHTHSRSLSRSLSRTVGDPFTTYNFIHATKRDFKCGVYTKKGERTQSCIRIIICVSLNLDEKDNQPNLFQVKSPITVCNGNGTLP